MTDLIQWIAENWLELFGAVTGIIYVFLEIRQNLWLWPIGIITSAVYILVFFTGKLYADMLLQCYYLIISILGWYWWIKNPANQDYVTQPSESRTGERKKSQGSGVSRIKMQQIIILTVILFFLVLVIWFLLSEYTDSPVPFWDSLITSLSIVATWMLARKILEHWYIWIVVNTIAAILFYSRGLIPTTVLYVVYGIMSFQGLKSWKKTMEKKSIPD
jgi:nicotinamide mononucleotide transporter